MLVFILLTHNNLIFNKSAVGHEYHADLSKHASQTDGAQGFGGKYGVQKDRKDQVRL